MNQYKIRTVYEGPSQKSLVKNMGICKNWWLFWALGENEYCQQNRMWIRKICVWKYCSFLWSARPKLLLKINCIWLQGRFLVSQDCNTSLKTQVKKEGGRSQGRRALAPRFIHTLQAPAELSALSSLFPMPRRYRIGLEHPRICRLSCQHSPRSGAHHSGLPLELTGASLLMH